MIKSIKNILKISVFFVIIITASCISAYASTSQYLDDSFYDGKGLAYGDGLLAPTVGSSDDNVDMSRGEVMFSETDYTINGRGNLQIPIIRSYNTSISVGTIGETEYSKKRPAPEMVGYYYTCSKDDTDVLVGFHNEFEAFEAPNFFIGRDYRDAYETTRYSDPYYTYPGLEHYRGAYTYTLNKARGHVIITRDRYITYKRDSITESAHQIDMGNGWTIKKPGFCLNDNGVDDGDRYSVITFQDINGKVCNLEFTFRKQDDDTYKCRTSDISEFERDYTMSFVNPDNVYETVEHPKGFEYNFIIESGDGIKYYTEMTTTTSFRLKAVSDRYGNTALYDPANGAKYTLDSGEEISVSTSGITRTYNGVTETVISYENERITSPDDPDDFFKCDDIATYTFKKQSGDSPSDSDSCVKYTMVQYLAREDLLYAPVGATDIRMLIGNYIDTVEHNTGMKQRYTYTTSLSSLINHISPAKSYFEEYNENIYNKKTFNFWQKSKNTVKYVNGSKKEIYVSADAETSEKAYTYNFNVSGQLTSSETDTTDTYTYSCACFDAPVSRQDHTDGGTLSTVSKYDSKHRLTKQTAGDTETRYTYGKYNIPLTVETDKDANTVIKTVNTLTEDEKSIAETKVYENDVLKSRSTFTYDSYGNVTSETKYINDTDTAVTNYTHEYLPDCSKKTTVTQTCLKDADGNVLPDIVAYTITDPYGNTVESCDGNGNIQISTYDRLNRPLTVTNADESTKSYEYNSVENYVISTDELGYKIKVYYDPWGNGIKSEYLDNDAWKTLKESTFDFRHRLSRYKKYISDTDFSYADYTYDRRDNIDREKVYDMEDNQKRYIAYNHIHTRDSDGRPLYEVDTTYYNGNTAKVKKINKYNYLDKLIEETYKDGNTVLKTTTNTYDYVGNKTGSTFPNGSTESYTYNHAGNVLTYTNPMGNTMTYEYDMAGRNTSVTDFKGNATTYEYDSAGRKIKIYSPFDGAETALKKTYYDSNGNVIKEMTKKNAAGEADRFKTMQYTYDNMNRLTCTDNGIADSSYSARYTRYEYNSKGNMIHVLKSLKDNSITYATKPSGCRYVDYEYDRFGRVIHMSGYSAYDTTYTYDLTGNKLSETVANGNSVGYEYDILGNITRVYDKNTGTNKATYTYNDLGQRISMTDPTGTTTYTTDQYGNLLTETKGDILKTYTYDISGNKATFTLADGGVQKINTSYAYDNLNRLTSVTDTGISAEYSYDINGNLTQKSVNGNVIAEYTYNQGNMPITLTDTIGETTKTYTTTYYLDGNKKSEGTCAEDMRMYKYDDADELIEETYGNKYTIAYQYDGMQVRKREAYTDLTTNEKSMYTYAATPQGLYSYRILNTETYDPRRGDEKSDSCDRDDNGNITDHTYYSETWARIRNFDYTYDAFNRMITSSIGGVTTTYAYNGDNLRQSKTTNGVTTSHVYDGSDIVYEKKGSDTYVYIRGLELIASKKNDGEFEYYHHDVHGSVIAKTNSNGQTDVYEYDAFGNMESTSTTDTENPFKYCGEYVDEETGFVYLRNRYYDPSIGCFTTIDPAMDGVNWYVYCANNPVSYCDPSGLSITSSKDDSQKIIELLKEIVANSLEFAYEDGQITIKKTYDTKNHVGQTLVSDLINANETVNINVGILDNEGFINSEYPSKNNQPMQIYIDPENKLGGIFTTYTQNDQGEVFEEKIPAYVVFGHELVHSWRDVYGLDVPSREEIGAIPCDYPKLWREEEIQTMGINYTDSQGNKMRDYKTYTGIISENGLRAENGINTRISYYGW